MDKTLFRSVVMVPVVVALTAGGMALSRAAGRSKTLPVHGHVPAFLLVDQHSRTVTNDTLTGSPWIADFIFTRCSGQCPMMTAQLSKVGSDVPAEVKLVSITVDPAWDSPQVLGEYATHYGADSRWLFVTGDPEVIRRLCREGFQLSVSEDGDPTLLTHSSRLVLVDRKGQIRGYYEADDEAAMQQLRLDAKAL